MKGLPKATKADADKHEITVALTGKEKVKIADLVDTLNFSRKFKFRRPDWFNGKSRQRLRKRLLTGIELFCGRVCLAFNDRRSILAYGGLRL